jgi:DNA-binding NarL/FixJ family response regulator
MTSVVIVDDEAMVRDGLRLILELGGVAVAGEARDGAEAFVVVSERRPDVVLMDLRMPGTDGIQATRRIVGAGLPSRVLVLTTFNLDSQVYEALRAGAAGFLLKDVTGERLVAAVNETAAGNSPVAGPVLSRLIEHFVTQPPSSLTSDRLNRARLSDRELEVLSLIGAGRSNSEIAEDLTISVATVKSHVRHILAKLDLRDRVQAVVLAHEARLAGAGAQPRLPWSAPS